ncbi:MAG TPA: alpha/beta hydrolase [Candidatus Limnocylindrales bacterium]|nr:alpha/beta hydrolase [Candidatus Limnocylindrales bacterium]
MTTEPAGAGRPRFVVSRDGTPIAVFATGEGPPIILVHGTTADHTTFRASGPLLARTFSVHAVDRRGRGASGDAGDPYRIEREYEDLAAVAEAVAEDAGEPVDLMGHSYGGRCALGAAVLTDAIGRVVVYEGAPSPAGREGYRPAGVEQRIAELIRSGDRDEALATFFREVVRMPEPDLAAYRADPIWPIRAAAVHTTLREMAGEGSPAASLGALGRVEQPVLQILGGDSPEVFREATRALDARLADGRIVVIDGARHAAHHTHVEPFVASIRAFLARPPMAD